MGQPATRNRPVPSLVTIQLKNPDPACFPLTQPDIRPIPRHNPARPEPETLPACYNPWPGSSGHHPRSPLTPPASPKPPENFSRPYLARPTTKMDHSGPKLTGMGPSTRYEEPSPRFIHFHVGFGRYSFRGSEPIRPCMEVWTSLKLEAGLGVAY